MRRAVLVLVVACVALCGCAGGPSETEPAAASAPPSGVRTIPALPPVPEPPPTGRLLAEMRQSSHDAAAGQVEVWIDNDTHRDVVPTRIVYADPRFPAPLVAGRLRPAPAQAFRGFPLVLPARPRCGSDAPAGSGRVTVRVEGGGTFRGRVSDDTDVVGRYLAARCAELALTRVVRLSWLDRVEGSLLLRVEPTGVPGTVELLSVGGSHLLGSADGRPWAPGVVVRGDDAPSTVALSVRPARCDVHAFMEGGNATAFRVGYAVDGAPGTLLLRMDPDGAAAAIAYARAECGLG